MSNRFHNKFHRFNHSTTKDINIPDSGYDPIASHEFPFKGDFVQYPDGAVLSARDIATNTVIPFSGNIITFPYPYTVVISNLSAISATVNYQDILVSELSGFVINGLDNTLQIHPIQIEGVNNLTLKGTPISSTSWVSISGDFQTQSNMYVSGVAYIANEYVTNITAVNLSAYDANMYNLTSVNNWFINENVVHSHITNLTATNLSAYDANLYNLNVSNNTITNHLTATDIQVNGDFIEFSPNLESPSTGYRQGLFLGRTLGTQNQANSANMVIAGSMSTGMSDGWHIYGDSTGIDAARLIIETFDNGLEPIIFRQHDLGIPYERTRIDSTGMTVTGNMVVTNMVSANSADFTNLSANHIYPHTSNTTISAHGNLDMLGYSISGIGNSSLSFQNGVKLSTNSTKSFIISAYSVSENPSCSATGQFSHAEGLDTTSSNLMSHAEGYYTRANGFASHTEGQDTVASKNAGHAEGGHTIAGGDYSHAGGYYANAIHDYTYVWSSFGAPGVSSTKNDQYTVSAMNGVVLGENVDVYGTLSLNGSGISAWPIGDVAVDSLVHNNSANWNTAYNNMSSVDFTNSYVFSGVVSPAGLYLTLSINGSSLALPLYYYPTGIGNMSIGYNFIVS